MSKYILIDHLRACAQHSKLFVNGLIGEVAGTVADALTELDDAKVDKTALGAANGVATLDSDGLLVSSQRWTTDSSTDVYTKAEVDAMIADLEDKIAELQMNTMTNTLTVAFDSLADVTATGVWNESSAQMEF